MKTIEKAHKYLTDKGCKRICQKYTAHEVVLMLNEFVEISSSTEIIGSVKPCFEFSGKATKYKQGVAVDTDGIALSNDILPHKAYTLEEGVEYIVKLYKA